MTDDESKKRLEEIFSSDEIWEICKTNLMGWARQQEYEGCFQKLKYPNPIELPDKNDMNNLHELFYPSSFRSMEEHKKLCEPYLSKYEGLPKSLAIIQAKNEGWGFVEINSEDGVKFPFSASFCFGRISFDVENNIVRKVDVG